MLVLCSKVCKAPKLAFVARLSGRRNGEGCEEIDGAERAELGGGFGCFVDLDIVGYAVDSPLYTYNVNGFVACGRSPGDVELASLPRPEAGGIPVDLGREAASQKGGGMQAWCHVWACGLVGHLWGRAFMRGCVTGGLAL